MTTSAKKRTGAKRRTVRRRAETPFPYPEAADRAQIAGKEYLLIPTEEFEEWVIDTMVGAVCEQRSNEDKSRDLSLEEVEADLYGKKKGRRG